MNSPVTAKLRVCPALSSERSLVEDYCWQRKWPVIMVANGPLTQSVTEESIRVAKLMNSKPVANEFLEQSDKILLIQ